MAGYVIETNAVLPVPRVRTLLFETTPIIISLRQMEGYRSVSSLYVVTTDDDIFIVDTRPIRMDSFY